MGKGEIPSASVVAYIKSEPRKHQPSDQISIHFRDDVRPRSNVFDLYVIPYLTAPFALGYRTTAERKFFQQLHSGYQVTASEGSGASSVVRLIWITDD